MLGMRSTRGTALLLVMLSMGCGAPTALPDPDSGSLPDAGLEPMTDSGMEPVDGGPSYPIDHPCDEPCTIAWRELAPFDVPLDHHSTFVLERDDGAYLYVLGGIQPSATSVAAYNARISAARILEDGTLGPWAHEDFRFGIGFHAQAQYVNLDGHDSMLWIGGILHDSTDTDLSPSANPYAFGASFPPGIGPGIEGMHVGDAGSVAAFAGRLSAAVLHGTAAVRERPDGSGRDVFLIGGSRDSTVRDALRYDTSTDTWVSDTELPMPRSHHVLVQHDGRLYLIGGFSGTVALPVAEPSIVRSIHAEDGHITGWEEVGTMEDPPWTAGGFVHEGHVYIVGGGASGGHHGGGEFLARVRRAPLGDDGRVGAFEDLSPIPMARAHVHQAPLYRGRIYSVGGRVMDALGAVQSSPRVFVGTLE